MADSTKLAVARREHHVCHEHGKSLLKVGVRIVRGHGDLNDVGVGLIKSLRHKSVDSEKS
uniref:Uncharacterized protein n=1 Tax=Hyaloperonospora arabidopsidis (strain Emoy2) TaxID=559515 RepID=M4B4H1_HYAAE